MERRCRSRKPKLNILATEKNENCIVFGKHADKITESVVLPVTKHWLYGWQDRCVLFRVRIYLASGFVWRYDVFLSLDLTELFSDYFMRYSAQNVPAATQQTRTKPPARIITTNYNSLRDFILRYWWQLSERKIYTDWSTNVISHNHY